MDPISDLLTTIRNSSKVGNQRTGIAYSKVLEAICKILAANSIINNYEIKEENSQKKIEIILNQNRKIQHLRRISKPGRRIYVQAKNIHAPLSGLGFMIISTPRGMLESRMAKKLGIGGEVICEMW